MITIARSRINEMSKNIIDEETGMTEFDLFENQHSCEDWNIIEDVKKTA